MTKQNRHGDPYDYPDIPGESGLGDAYYDAVTPPHVKEAIARRKAASTQAPKKKVA